MMGGIGENAVKACSFLPGATDMIQRMGLAEQLVGVTFECRSDKPKVVRSVLEGRRMGSGEIDRTVKEHARTNTPLYYIDIELLRELAPDVIFTQHVCNVCQIGTAYVEQAIRELDKRPKLVPLVPQTFEDVLDNAMTIAGELGAPEAGVRHVEEVRERLRRLSGRLSGTVPVRVVFIEWLDPVYNSGHWIPDMIRLAGGIDLLGVPGGYSGPVDWQDVVGADPDVIVAAPCGLSLEQAFRDMRSLAQRPGWETLRAVRENRVFLLDPDLFTCPSTALADGVELLAGLFHPERIALPASLVGKRRVWQPDPSARGKS